MLSFANVNRCMINLRCINFVLDCLKVVMHSSKIITKHEAVTLSTSYNLFVLCILCL